MRGWFRAARPASCFAASPVACAECADWGSSSNGLMGRTARIFEIECPADRRSQMRRSDRAIGVRGWFDLSLPPPAWKAVIRPALWASRIGTSGTPDGLLTERVLGHRVNGANRWTGLRSSRARRGAAAGAYPATTSVPCL